MICASNLTFLTFLRIFLRQLQESFALFVCHVPELFERRRCYELPGRVVDVLIPLFLFPAPDVHHEVEVSEERLGVRGVLEREQPVHIDGAHRAVVVHEK